MNKYERVILAAMRARELSEGINVNPEMAGKKVTTLALEELASGKLKLEGQKENE